MPCAVGSMSAESRQLRESQSDNPAFVRSEVARLAEKGVDGIKVVLQDMTTPEGLDQTRLGLEPAGRSGSW
jgi:hypothetical protein